MIHVVPARHLSRSLAAACRETSRSYNNPNAITRKTHCNRRLHTTPDPELRSLRQIQRQSVPVTSRRHLSNSTTHTSTSQDNASASPPWPGKATQLPDITNHYTLFPATLSRGPPPGGSFSISLPALRKEFLQIQSQHHPDKHRDEPAHSKALALSALINNAYRTLSDPLLRAQYLLRHNYDVDVMSEDNSHHPTDADTLMEVMEAQERIEDAETQAQIDEIRAENTKRIEDTVEALGGAFERDDAVAATRECVRLRYWQSLEDGLHSWEPGKEVRLVH